jgi:class 3 adenylate cyclase/tetratricopeptide (TPR) repeat protein
MDVREFLLKLGLERYEAAFRENNIDAALLPSLTAEDLKDLGVALVGDRRRLLQAIAALRESAPERQPDRGPREAERRQLSVVFVDLVGSTALSGRLDPEEYRGLITAFQKAVSAAVRRFEGHVAKFLGDGVLVYFGYPAAHEDDAERAVRSGLEALAAIARLAAPSGEALAGRIGIATGLVVAGDVDEGEVAESGAVSGETPNLAARLQGLALPGEMVVCENTLRLVAGIFDTKPLGPQRLKGIAAPVPAWRVTGERRAESRFDARTGAGLTEFVGRSDEVELLLRRWERARGGAGQVVLISGEPGIGKSRLSQHLRDQLAGTAMVVLKYQCSPHHANSVLYPVRSQLAFAAGIAGDEPDERKLDKLEALLARATDEVVSVAPLFAELLSLPYRSRYAPLELSPATQKAKTMLALLDQLLGLARRQPVLLVFEDLHWLDPTTQELLDLVVERIQDAAVLALLTFRPEYRPRWLGQPHVTLLALSRLDRRQCEEMARRVIAAGALSPAMLEDIVRRTEGVPLFVEELTRTLLEGGRSETVPTTIQASLLARLDRLGAARQLAQIGAAIGREFDHRLLEAVAPLRGNELAEAIERLVGSELVFRRGTAPDASYVFKHALVQDAAYDSLLKSSRRRIHGEIAAALGTLFPALEAGQPELLAHHHAQAGNGVVALDYLERAGERALQLSANREAVQHYRAALALVDSLPQAARPARELALQLGLGSALTSVEGYSAPATGAAYRRAQELCLAIGDTRRIFPVIYGLWNVDNTAGRLHAAQRTGRDLLQRAEADGAPGSLIAACSGLGTTLSLMGRWAEAHALLDRCSRLYDPVRDAQLKIEYAEDPCVQARCMDTACLWHLGRPDEALALTRWTRELAERLRHDNSMLFSMSITPILHRLRDDPAAMLAGAEEGLSFSRERGSPFWIHFTAACRGWALARLGDLGQGMAEAIESVKVLETDEHQVWFTAFLAMLADIFRMAARHEDSLNTVERGLHLAAERGEQSWTPELLRIRGLVVAEADSPASGEAVLLHALQVARDQGSRSMELRLATDLARLWRRDGRNDDATALLQPLHAAFTEGFDTPLLREAAALLG